MESINNKDKTEKPSKLTQQILHKSMFTRTRSHSLGTLHTETQTQTDTSDNSHIMLSTTDANNEKSKSNKSWQNDQVPTKRKAESSPEMVNKTSKLTKTTYAIATENRYQILETVNNEELNALQKEPKPPKPEPIFVTGVIDIKKLKELLSMIVESDKYTMTTLRSGHIVKIMPADVDTYKHIRANFITNDVSHYTYKLKSERAYRVVLRGLHSSEDTEQIKQQLFELGHEVRQITNVIHKNTKSPLPLYYVDLEPKHNNKEIFNIKQINRVKITFEAPYKKLDILQCKRCQRFGHAKNQCNRPFRCVKCGEEHPTTSCLKRPDTDATCANCQEKHPASYKGCTKYKQYRDILNKNKTKSTNDMKENINNNTENEHPIESKQKRSQHKNDNQHLKPNFTYAQAVNYRNANETKTDSKETNNFSELLDIMIDKFQNMMTVMLDKMMDRMVQLVASLIKHP